MYAVIKIKYFPLFVTQRTGNDVVKDYVQIQINYNGGKMKKNIFIGLAITIIMVSGCATTYDTEKSHWTGNRGFSQEKLEKDVWQIKFTGNAHTDTEIRKKYILKKAAQIAIEDSYSFFKVIQSDSSKDITGSDVTEENSTTRMRGRSKKTYVHTNTFTTMTVKLLNEKTGVDGTVYDANFLLNSKIE